MKIIRVSGVCILVGIFLLSACGDSQVKDAEHIQKPEQTTVQISGKEVNKTGKYNIVYEVDSHADQLYNYETLEELVAGSEYIVSGNICDISFGYTPEGAIYSRYQFEIKESLYGELNKGDVITVSEPGGIVPVKEYAENAKSFVVKDWESLAKEDYENGYICSYCDGEPIPEVGEECYLFLWKVTAYEPDIIYAAIGNYQGKINIKNDEASRYLPKDSKGKRTFTNSNSLKSQIKKLIKESR